MLTDVSHEMAAWRPGTDLHSIWALTLHMAYWKWAVRQRILGLPDTGFERTPDNFPEVPSPTSQEAWDADRGLLAKEEKALVALTESLEEDRLRDMLSPSYRVADQLMGIAMHDAHHVAQILLLKRLWADRGSSS